MSINRGTLSFSDHFVQVPNSWVRDTRISRRARGLLCELFSHSKNWVITIDSLVATGTEGRDAIRAAIKELESAGYLTRDRRRAEAGQFAGAIYSIVDPWETRVGLSDVGSANVGETPTKKTMLKEEQVLEHKESRPRGRPAPAPASFEVSEELKSWALSKAPRVTDLAGETEKFLDYHRAKGSKFSDWTAAWRTWIRRSDTYLSNQQTLAEGTWW